MLSPDSEIADFYPIKYETDLNGKQNDWEVRTLAAVCSRTRRGRALTHSATRRPSL